MKITCEMGAPKVFTERMLFASRSIACEMGVLKVFMEIIFVCRQVHCMQNWCFIVIILFAHRPIACEVGVP